MDNLTGKSTLKDLADRVNHLLEKEKKNEKLLTTLQVQDAYFKPVIVSKEQIKDKYYFVSEISGVYEFSAENIEIDSGRIDLFTSDNSGFNNQKYLINKSNPSTKIFLPAGEAVYMVGDIGSDLKITLSKNLIQLMTKLIYKNNIIDLL